MSSHNGTTPGASSMDEGIDLLYSWWPPQTTTTPCPEALFSLTLRGKLDGQEALLTARGQTAEEFKRNLEAIRGLLDAPMPAPASSQPQGQGQGEGQGWCAVHNVAMKLQQKGERTWYSHRTDDGFCKGV